VKFPLIQNRINNFPFNILALLVLGVDTFYIKYLQTSCSWFLLWQKCHNGNNDNIHRENVLGTDVNFKSVILSWNLKHSER
jgi:hypothetical protein